MMNSFKILTVAGVILLIASGAFAGMSCDNCHGSKEITKMDSKTRLGMVKRIKDAELPEQSENYIKNLYVNFEKFKKSVHGGMDCKICHSDITSTPHKYPLKPVDCGKCHSETTKKYRKSLHYKAHKEGDDDAPLCRDCHGNHYILPKDNPESRIYSSSVPGVCEKCHADEDMMKRRDVSLKNAAESYARSVHGKSAKEGSVLAATCTDCHGVHLLLGSDNPKSKVYKKNVAKTCGKCHSGIYKDYKISIHGKKLEKGVMESPTCTDCHGEHYILGPGDKDSLVYSNTISKTTCPQCHGREKLARKYGLPSESIKTYKSSFHGLADRYGDTSVANCASCHAHHKILPEENPKSTVHPDNLSKTCGKCHPGATENFTKGSIHGYSEETLGEKIKNWVKYFYIVIIVLTIGGMLLHNALDYIRKLIIRYTERQAEKQYLRLTFSERLSHIVLLTTFGMLVVTGFALYFNWRLPFLSGDVNNFLRGTLHRIAAVLNTVFCIYHIGYVIFTERGRYLMKEMMPRWKDVTDAFQMIKFYFGKAPKPEFKYFNYAEKLEYFALVWGTVIMFFTGIILWFEGTALQYIPYWGVDLANIIHLYEAILATLAIIVWHLYYVILNPDFAPMNLAWLSGTLTEEEMREEHPEALRELEE